MPLLWALTNRARVIPHGNEQQSVIFLNILLYCFVYKQMKQFFYLNYLTWGIALFAGAQQTPSEQKDPSKPASQSSDPFAANFEDEEVYAPPTIIQSIEYIEVSLADTTRLLFDENLITDSVKLREALGVMLKEGKAKMFDTISTVSRAGVKATSESIEEMIYPTEYEPPELPSSVLVPDKQVNNPDLLKALGLMKTPATPTSFEPRHLGSTIETESTLHENESKVEIRLAPEFVSFIDWSKFNEETDVLGNKHDIRMPKFSVMRIASSVTIPVGKPQFIGLHTAISENGQLDPNKKIIAILRCHVININSQKK